MKSSIKVFMELVKNIKIIHRLSVHELITQNKGNIFGILWLWVNPAIQIGIYAFVYGYGIRNSSPVDGQPFFFWLVPGFIMWMFINGVINKASRSIVAKMGLVTKMRFPVSITPAVVIISELYVHIMMVITVGIVFALSGYPITKYWLQIPYFTFAATCFLYSLSLFNSAITTIVRDYQHVVYNVMRTMFFITPALFPMDNRMASGMKLIMKLNPFTYLIEGYRDAFLFARRTILMSTRWGAYFWGITIILFIVGSILNVRMRKNLLDYA